MTLPVPSTLSAMVDKFGKIIPPWNSWFQQFSEPPEASTNITGGSFTPNVPGNIFIKTGTPIIIITRGSSSITITGQKIIPISIGDKITFTNAYTAEFWPS